MELYSAKEEVRRFPCSTAQEDGVSYGLNISGEMHVLLREVDLFCGVVHVVGFCVVNVNVSHRGTHTSRLYAPKRPSWQTNALKLVYDI